MKQIQNTNGKRIGSFFNHPGTADGLVEPYTEIYARGFEGQPYDREFYIGRLRPFNAQSAIEMIETSVATYNPDLDELS